MCHTAAPFASLAGGALKHFILCKGLLGVSLGPSATPPRTGRGAGKACREVVCREGKDGAVVSMVRFVAKGTGLHEPWVWQLGTFATGSERLIATVDLRP